MSIPIKRNLDVSFMAKFVKVLMTTANLRVKQLEILSKVEMLRKELDCLCLLWLNKAHFYVEQSKFKFPSN